MINTIITTSNNRFIYDTDTVQIENDIVICDFVNLHCLKTITEKGTSYEYPEIFFKKTKMCRKQNIISEFSCLDEDLNIFYTITSNLTLSKEDREYLRKNYLKVEEAILNKEPEQMELL